MATDDDLAKRAVGLLQVAIAVINEDADAFATRRLPTELAEAAFDQLIVAADDIAVLARACKVLHRRAKTF